jgi:hypothetical protein
VTARLPPTRPSSLRRTNFYFNFYFNFYLARLAPPQVFFQRAKGDWEINTASKDVLTSLR